MIIKQESYVTCTHAHTHTKPLTFINTHFYMDTGTPKVSHTKTHTYSKGNSVLNSWKLKSEREEKES